MPKNPVHELPPSPRPFRLTESRMWQAGAVSAHIEKRLLRLLAVDDAEFLAERVPLISMLALAAHAIDELRRNCDEIPDEEAEDDEPWAGEEEWPVDRHIERAALATAPKECRHTWDANTPPRCTKCGKTKAAQGRRKAGAPAAVAPGAAAGDARGPAKFDPQSHTLPGVVGDAKADEFAEGGVGGRGAR